MWARPNYSLITFRNIETIIKTLKKLENNFKKSTSENKDSANEYNNEYNVVNELRRNITAVKDNLPFLSNLPLETRNDMAEYNLKTKNALRLIVKDQNTTKTELELSGLDPTELEFMDPEERKKLLIASGLDPKKYDF